MADQGIQLSQDHLYPDSRYYVYLNGSKGFRELKKGHTFKTYLL